MKPICIQIQLEMDVQEDVSLHLIVGWSSLLQVVFEELLVEFQKTSRPNQTSSLHNSLVEKIRSR